MPRHGATLALVIILLSVGTLSVVANLSGVDFSNLAVIGPGFSFGIAGDFGGTSYTAGVLRGMDDGTSFAIANGDLSYGQTGVEPTDYVTPSPWCNFVKTSIPNAGSEFPFFVVAGNHEMDVIGESRIHNISKCLPVTGSGYTYGSAVGLCGPSLPDGRESCYGVAYYLDVPNARVFVFYHSSSEVINGISPNFNPGTGLFNWLSSSIDQAKSQGLWTIAAVHKPCIAISGGESGCGMHNLLVQKKVDLVISGDSHYYLRSKQLSCFTVNTYRFECVVDDGTDNVYSKGVGTVYTVVGTGGNGLTNINLADGDAGYFVKWSGQNIEPTYGYAKVTVNSNGIGWNFVPTTPNDGSFTDNFTIGSSTPPPISVSFNHIPTAPLVGETVAFSASATNIVSPVTWTVSFGDGSSTTIATQTVYVTHVYNSACSCQVIFSVRDANNQQGSLTRVVGVSEPAPALSFQIFWNPQLPKIGETVTFGVTINGGTGPYNIDWLFGDGLGASGESVSHSYSQSGSFNVVATVSDSGGQSNSDSVIVTVQAPLPPNPLIASFSWSPLLPVSGQNVNFSSSVSGGVTPYQRIEWNFGDGTTENGVAGNSNRFHAYLLSGSYTVSLTVVDADGNSRVSSNTITVKEPSSPGGVGGFLNLILQTLPFVGFGGAIAVGSVAIAGGRRKK